MENPREYKKPKIYDTEIQKNIQIEVDHLKKNHEFIKEILNQIEENTDFLNDKITYLQQMEIDKQFSELGKEMTAEKHTSKYSDVEIESVKNLIETYKKSIEDLKLVIETTKKNDIFVNRTIEIWNKTQEDYNNILLKISRVKLN